jgi:hypothetical protein
VRANYYWGNTHTNHYHNGCQVHYLLKADTISMNDYIEKSGFGNHILYSMCRDQPLHDDPELIGGKLWLIGRAYSATVERKAGPNFNWEPLKQAIISSDIDQHIQHCKKIKRIDADNLSEVLKAHKVLTDIFKRATGLEKRSLASKYLHFHAPSAFFIYDSIAAKSVQKNIKHLRVKSRAESNNDSAYEVFCKRCLVYRDRVLEPKAGQKVSPRYLDATLLGYQATT